MSDFSEHDGYDVEESGVQAAPDSPLARIREQLHKSARQSHTDLLVVPRSTDDVRVWVRYRYLDHAQIKKIQARFAKSKAPDVDVIANAVTLASAFEGLFTDDLADSPEEWLDLEALASVYEVESKRGADVIRALYDTDAAVLTVAAKFTDWLGYELEAVEERAAGN